MYAKASKKSAVLLLCIAALFLLSACSAGKEESGLTQAAEDSFQNARTIYYKMWEFDAYGEVHPVYFTSVDDILVPYLTNSLATLSAFSFEGYQETSTTAQERERADSFYLDCAESDGLLKVTVGADQQIAGVDLDEATMVLTINMVGDEENTVSLEGPLSAKLVEVARLGGVVQTIHQELEDSVMAKDLTTYDQQPAALTRGVGRMLEVLIGLVLENEEPEQGSAADFNIEAELPSGDVFLIDTEDFRIQKSGEDVVYRVTEESLTDFLSSLHVPG